MNGRDREAGRSRTTKLSEALECIVEVEPKAKGKIMNRQAAEGERLSD